jgi:UDP-N-acetylmuramate dehydrogenase
MNDVAISLPDRLGGFLEALSPKLRHSIRYKEPLWRYTTLRVGGPADLYIRVAEADDLAEVAAIAQLQGIPYFLLGGGSNICVSDKGIRGLVLHNLCRHCEIGPITRVDSGYPMMQLFLDSARASLSGLEFAVGIPGSVGGAMVSNAGAYRQNICDLVVEIDVVEGGTRKKVGPEWMEFSYRDSRLRRPESPPATIIAVTLKLEPKPRIEIMARARENQRQRIYKQPWYPSAGSFFKNVYNRALAESLPDLPAPMKEAGVVPAGYLSAACGCKGLTVGGAQISRRHGNFVVNRGHATAEDIRTLAEIVKARVRERFGVELQEEVLYVGEW